nr:hypothetical protein BYUHJPPR_BYUHJPPR_CDS_0006 [Microvirus sp.]
MITCPYNFDVAFSDLRDLHDCSCCGDNCPFLDEHYPSGGDVFSAVVSLLTET